MCCPRLPSGNLAPSESKNPPRALANPILVGRTAQILSLRVGQKLEAGHICKTKDAGKLKAASDKLKKLKTEGHEKFTNDE